MAKKCILTGKKTRSANNVSHAKNRTKRKQFPNIQKKKVFVGALGRFVTVKLSTKAIKVVNRVGVDAVMKKKGISVKELLRN